jgi:hypothetical protein
MEMEPFEKYIPPEQPKSQEDKSQVQKFDFNKSGGDDKPF